MNLHHGDCLEVMAAMEPDSVDAICTDPPYGLEFMGKAWDRLGDSGKVKHAGPSEHRETDPEDVYGRLRVANYGSANRKCRTCGHWEWSGNPCKCGRPDFPTREGRQGLLMQEWHHRWAEAAYRVAKPSAYLLAFGGTRTVHRLTSAIEDAGWIIRDMLVWAYASGFPKSKASLKPAWEPIVMARKPGPLRELAIDACRIGTGEDKTDGGTAGTTAIHGGGITMRAPVDFSVGRWPANVILTSPIFDGGWDGVVGGGETASGDHNQPFVRSNRAGFSGSMPTRSEFVRAGDSGTYSRFFVLPKASRADREPILTPDWFEGTGRVSTHPTVKPTDLMRHLVRLVTPTGGTVLDPFLGSGSTAIAAEMEGFPWIGIEKEREYCDIAEARLNGTQRGLGLPA